MTALSSDPSTSRLLLASVALIGISLLILAGIIFLRFYQIRNERFRSRRDEFWDDWFDEMLAGENVPSTLPGRSSEDFKHFLSRWIDCFGEKIHRDQLRALADAVDLSETLQNRYSRFSFHVQLLALTILGYLEERRSWRLFQLGLDANNPLVKLVALRAMLHAHPRRALDELFGSLRHDDLPTSQVQFLLSNLPPKRIETVLLNHLETASSDVKERLIPYLSSAPTEGTIEWIGSELKNSDNPETIAQSLRVLGSIGTPEHASWIKPFLEHESWFVRVRAVHALGKLKYHEDEMYLEKIRDSNWWVRRAAAIHLIRSTDHDPETLNRYLDELEDPYAQEQLQERMEEEAISCIS